MSRWSAVVVCCWRVSECRGGVLLLSAIDWRVNGC